MAYIDFDRYDDDFESSESNIKKIVYSDSKAYYGEVNEQGEPHGEGRLCECNAFDLRIRIYFGEFKDGKKNGKGKIYDLFHGTIEYGIWKDDERKEYLGVYVGEVKKVIPLIYPQENIFDGMFNIVRSCFTQLSALEDVVREGRGEFTFNGDSKEGIWKNDKLIEGV